MGFQFRISWVTPIIVYLVSIVPSSAQGSWSNPNGLVRPIRNTAMNCGNCPAGYQREPGAYGMCGNCVPEHKSCAPGYVLVGNQCSQCPCPSTNRNFGTACRVDDDGQITCDCPDGYAGRDCGQCAPGATQSTQYPYNCIRYNGTSSVVTPGCPAGNYCPSQPINQILQTPPIYPPQVGCPTSTCYPTQQCPVAPPQPQPRPNPWPQPQPIPNPCPIPLPGPGPILCPTQPSVCPPCPTTPVVNGPCPIQPQCPVNPPLPPPIQCPPCPINPQIPCPIPCPQPCPQPQPCPSCPPNCPQIPPPQPCNQCPDPCQRCPEIPSCPMCPPCPNCPQIPPCNQCPNPCPPCESGPGCNVNCPDTCKACPQCPDCKLNVTCPGAGPEGLPCICDARGTISQSGDTCFCKTNVGGQRCNTCKPGYFGLTGKRMDGCLQCWGSGVSSYCSAAVYYRLWITTSRASDCSLELIDEANTVVYDTDSNRKLSWDGKEARLSLTVSTRLFWSLPNCFKGNRLTSYGGILRFSRMFTGSGNSLGADNDVIIVGGNGARLYYSSFKNQSSGGWEKLEVLLDETTHMVYFKNSASRTATRFDILEVLADVHLILIRATFTATTMSTSIKDVELGTVSKTYTSYGFVFTIEQARCPTGYQGLSCESCAFGYYRDVTDMTASVFGGCKFCPCGRNALGCHVSYGEVVCSCKPGFTGDRCQDREVITVTLDPFWVRDCENTEIDFTCTFTTNSKRQLLMRLGLDPGPGGKPDQVKTISRTFTLLTTTGRVKCEIVDQNGLVWATVYGAMKPEPCAIALVVPPKTITIITDDFICVDEGDRVVMKADVYYYGSIKVKPEWSKEGDTSPLYNGPEFVIHRATLADRGTYIVSALQGDTIDVKHIMLEVRPSNRLIGDDPSVLMIDNGSSSFNKSSPTNKTQAIYKSNNKVIMPPLPPQKPGSRPYPINSMQKDQPISGYPSVVVEPAEVRAQAGETVTLHCNASGEEPMKFYWKSGSSDYIPVHVKVSRGALIFKAVRKEDEGSYYCVAWNTIGQVTARANIVVEDKPVIPLPAPLTVFLSKSHAEVAEGTHAYFNCSTNSPTVKPSWSRKGGELPKNSEVTGNGTLIIYRVRNVDAGVYVCKAMGPGGNFVEVEATLGFIPVTPSTIPVISLTPKSPVKGRSGEQVRIECSASGYPPPNVTWSRSIEGSEKKLVTTPQSNLAVYDISHLTKADEGKYTCTAVNVAGSKSESLSLIVDDAILCKTSEFRCKSGDQCIPVEDRCDNEKDCKDGSDEHHCRKRSRRQVS